MNVFEEYYYDETSPSCLRHARGKNRRIKEGDRAGSINKNRWVVKCGPTSYMCARVIWALHNDGEFPEEKMCIVHRDDDKHNLKIDNLVCISKAKAVKLDKLIKGKAGTVRSNLDGTYRAYTRVNREPDNLVGKFDCPEKAHRALRALAVLYLLSPEVYPST